MLKRLDGIPPFVAAFQATGEVSKDDYKQVLIPEVERVNKEHGHIHFLMVMETPSKNFSFGAWLQDAVQGLKHFRNWKKVAIVSDETGLEKLSSLFSFLVPGEVKGFPLAQQAEAERWVVTE